jgi:hypothetical protein
MVGILGETFGSAVTFWDVLLPMVLKSRTSAALAEATTPARSTHTTKTVRINFIYEPPFSKGLSLFNPFFLVLEL